VCDPHSLLKLLLSPNTHTKKNFHPKKKNEKLNGFNLLAQRCRSETENFILKDLFSSALSQFKKISPPETMKFNNLGILQSSKLRILMEKILPISLKLNFTPNTLACYGLLMQQY